MSGDVKQEIKTFRPGAPPPMPPMPTEAQASAAPAPQAPAAPPPPAQDPLAMMNAPSAPKAPPAPPAVPTPPPAASAPAPAAPPQTGYATDTMLLQTKVNGKTVDVPISDVRKSVQMLSAAEQKFAEAGRMRAELQREAELGKTVLAHQNNPQMLLQRLAELTGRPMGVSQEAEDDGLDPHTRELKAELSEMKRVLSSFQQERVQQHTNSTLGAIREELGRFPLYQQDPGELEHAELVVAAFVSKDPNMSRSQIAEIAGELHAKRYETISRQTTLERDQRAANAAMHATVPPSAGTPGLTDNSPPKIEASQWQRGTGAFKAGLENMLAKLTQP